MLIGAHTFEIHNGYGRLARNFVAAFDNLNFRVGIVPGMIPIPPDLHHLVRKGDPDVLVYPPFTHFKAPIQVTTYESTKLPEEAARMLRKRDKIIVPCEQNKQMCRDSGIKKPVHVVNPAVNVGYKQPAPFSPFTFLHVGADNSVPQRKRTHDVIKAFLKAFPSESDVRLIIKKDSVDARVVCFDKRVEIIQEVLPSLTPLYEKSHVGIFPCGQEGWGYCQSDMMGVGRPVAVPFFGGPADFCDATCAYSLPFTMKKVPKQIYHGIGECAHVPFDAIVDTFRFCYKNKEDTILKGVLAYRKMLGFTFTHMIAQLGKIL